MVDKIPPSKAQDTGSSKSGFIKLNEDLQKLTEQKNKVQDKAINNAIEKELLGTEKSVEAKNKELKHVQDLEAKPIQNKGIQYSG